MRRMCYAEGMMRTLFLMILIFATPAVAQQKPHIKISMPSALKMQEMSKLLPPAKKTIFTQIAKPNQMIAAYLGADDMKLMMGGSADLPREIVIIAVPEGNPTVTLAEFPLLKKELHPRMEKVGAVTFKDTPRWLGTTKQHQIEGKTYLFSTAVVSVKNHVLMVQVLRTATAANDVKFLHRKVEYIVDHLLSENAQEPSVIPPQATPAPAQPQKAVQPRSAPKGYFLSR